MKSRRFSSWLVFLALVAALFSPAPGGHDIAFAQTATPANETRDLLESMTPEERVGQLFLVTFTGTEVSQNTQIYDLIVNYHVGGVVLLAANDNFTAAPQTVPDVHHLIAELQKAEWDSSLVSGTDPLTKAPVHLNYVPLFIGISQEGAGYPQDQILSGLTPMPNPMALGATWQPDLAGQVGEVQGQEFSAIGFNLYLGPSLDVLESPNPTGSGDLGTRVFGGDPYWVGEMGRAFISGLHTGSNGRLLVITKHFPGRGGSDRLPEEEVATVRKSLEQLKQIELAPFFAVTGNAPSMLATADGLLVSHIRYQGLQGNIRATTRPVSFDSQALTQILALPYFATWRANGGLIVSGDLGSQAVRQFYDPGGGNFLARLVARDAFLAGNDLLYLGNIVSSNAPDDHSTVLEILDFFAQKYREDSAFAQRVDAAVERILSLKRRLYGDFSLLSVQASSKGLDVPSASSQVTFDVARHAATLISPDLQDLDSVLPAPPDFRERLLFITDVHPDKQCSTCPEQPSLAVDALQAAILRLYGPGAGGQVFSNHLSSYSFDDLSRILQSGDGHPQLEADLRQSDWVVLSMLDARNDQPLLLRRFLSEKQDLLRAKRVILFSFGAPYYLDATDISKLTAYYCLYSRTLPFVEVAARLLYQELTPEGASPVSIPAIGYDLINVTSPEPSQIIPLYLDLPPLPTPTAQEVTPEPTPIPLFMIGDTISFRTGVIVDHNQHAVPDGTVARFSLVMGGEGGGVIQQVETVTTGGVARGAFRLEKPGLLEIHAASDPAFISEVLQLDVSTEVGAAVTVIVPIPTATPPGTPPAAQTPANEAEGGLTANGYPRLGGWLLAVIVLGGGAWLAYWTGGLLRSQRWGVRWALCVVLGGLAAYNYLALGLPGSVTLISAGGIFGMLGLTVVGEMIGWGCGWLWSQRSSEPKSRSD